MGWTILLCPGCVQGMLVVEDIRDVEVSELLN